MNLENLNFKKGLIRLFIVSIVGAIIFGYFRGEQKQFDKVSAGLEYSQLLVSQFNLNDCDYIFIFKKPNTSPYTKECENLLVNINRILSFQERHPKEYPVINEKLIEDSIMIDIRESISRERRSNILVAILTTSAFWIFFLILAFVFRWIYKGFKG
jgi:ATP-dependent Zn protease